VTAPANGEAEHIVHWVQVLTGMEIDEADGARTLDAPRWRQRREELNDVDLQ
jgi:hypothetical protein